MQKQHCEYINIEVNIIVEAHPIVAGPVYHTSGISEILHIIMEPSSAMISHIAKDSFDFEIRLDNTALLLPHLVPVILNHYMLIFDMILFMQQLNTGLKICKMIYQIVKFVLEALSIILEFNYFCISGITFIRLKELRWEQNL